MRKHTLIIAVAFMMLVGCGDDGRQAELEREKQRAEQAEKARQTAEEPTVSSCLNGIALRAGA